MLDVSDFDPSETNACRIAATLQNNTTVKRLDFGCSHMRELMPRAIGDMLMSNRNTASFGARR
jgi:hypothetical protein